jgi:hypothetical protein
MILQYSHDAGTIDMQFVSVYGGAWVESAKDTSKRNYFYETLSVEGSYIRGFRPVWATR